MSDGRARFDPRAHLTRLPSGEYLEVKWRLAWFRSEHPAGRIDTEIIEVTPDYARVRATASYPVEVGGSIEWALGTGHGTATRTGSKYGDRYLERAETAAIGRALAALGYGTQYAIELDQDDAELIDAPVERPAEPEPFNPPPHRQSRSARPPKTGTAPFDRITEARMAELRDLARSVGWRHSDILQVARGLGYDIHHMSELTNQQADAVARAIQARRVELGEADRDLESAADAAFGPVETES